MLGASFALVSAALFGLNNATLRRGVVKGTVLQAMAITVPIGVPMFVAAAALMGGFQAIAHWGVASWAWMMLAGIMHFVIGRYGNYRATQLLGSNLSTPIQQLSIVVALGVAFLFLDETVTLLNLLGIVLVMFGPMIVVSRRRTPGVAANAAGFTPQYGAGLFWGAVCALGYGCSPLFVVLGIGDGGIADSIGGLLVSYGAATVVVVIWVLAAGGRAYMGGLDRESLGWFLLSALFVGLSQLFRYVALAVAPITVVTPIQRLSVVFRLLFNAVLNRDYEIFDRWIVASILLSVIGAVALAGDSAALLGWLGLEKMGWLARPIL